MRDPVVYARLRGIYSDVGWANARALPVRAPVPAYQVGRRRDEDVVLSPSSESSWQLRIDTSHRILFDHPVDHVPGMLLLEAARQAAQASVHRVTDAVTVTGMQTRFLRYTELDAPCWIKARPLSSGAAGARRVLVSAWQRDEEVFTAQVDLTAV
ncbi:hypothetical protein GCM10010289_62120 [Streptomyces violascens]|uniref:A-factor biosynthesis hotdog domain-containing protein n=1 Tax=Streptomyces violascens TaxID=67381 RepID=A0ABQ3R2A7_9ACTN|nr:hypothetical protein GCM10010289_62120 [Streptomyces violascens]GHI43637.1 hypothetical protein Sviol_80450 [Streptomyces violascens]